MTSNQIEMLIVATDRGMHVVDIADDVGVSDRTVYRYLAGEHDHLLTGEQLARLRAACRRRQQA